MAGRPSPMIGIRRTGRQNHYTRATVLTLLILTARLLVLLFGLSVSGEPLPLDVIFLGSSAVLSSFLALVLQDTSCFDRTPVD